MNFQRITFTGLLACLLLLGFSDTARAQSVTLSPQVLNFTVPTNTVSQPQQVAVTTSPAGASVIVSPPSAQWITVGQGSFNTPLTVNVSVNTQGLGQGSYSGTITVSFNPTTTIQQTVTVNLIVTGPSALSASPATVTFTGQTAATSGTPTNCALENSPTTCQVTISSSSTAFTYSVTPSATWILVSASQGTVGGTPLYIGVNPSLVPTGAGTYMGTVVVQSTTTADEVSIGVTLTVGANATLTVSPPTLNFYYTTGSANPASQTVTVSSTGGFIPFQVAQNFPAWLNVTPQSGSVNTSDPATLTVGVTPNAPTVLARGTYTSTISISPTNGGSPVTVTVNLIVSNTGILTLSATQLNFTAAFGGVSPAAQSVTVGSTGAAVPFTTTTSSDTGWLTVTPSSGTSGAALSVGVSQSILAGLGVGTYNGTVTVTPTNGDNYSLQFAAALTVTASSQITSAPQSVYFSYEIGQAQPANQTLVLASTGPATNFTVSATTTPSTSCGSVSWLNATAQLSPFTTPNYLNVGVFTAGLSPGTCSGTITISYGSGQTTTVPVTLFVNNATSPLLNISLLQGFGQETVTLGGSSIQRTISLSSTDGTSTLQYQVTVQSSPCPWLYAAANTGSSTGSTPTPVTVEIFPGCITSAGVYQGSISLTSTNGLPQTVTLPITLTVNSNISVSVSPASLTFNQTQAGAAPSPQLLSFSVTGGNASFIATPSTTFGGSWLSVTPGSGSTSVGTLTVNASSSSLPVGTYTGNIAITLTGAATSAIQVPVKLVIGAAQTLSVLPTSLNFSYTIGGTAPTPQQLTISSTGGVVNFTTGTTSSGGWLSVDTLTGSTPATGSKIINVSVNPGDFPTGTAAGNTLSGSITINAPSISSTATTIPVTVNILAPQAVSPSTISNSALPGIGFGPITPGEFVTILGTNLGPTTAATFTVPASGQISSTLAGVTVTFDGLPGTPTYVSAGQINVIVPWQIAGRTSTNVVVTYNSVPSAAIPQQVTGVAPAIYTLASTGSGQASVVNLTGTTAGFINGPATGVMVGSSLLATEPATDGSFIAVYGNGGGATNPASSTGTVTPSTQLYPLAGWTAGSSFVTATIGGVNAPVEFAGAAPTLVNGVLQVNLQVPAGVHGNALPISITINGVTTPAGATVAVQ